MGEDKMRSHGREGGTLDWVSLGTGAPPILRHKLSVPETSIQRMHLFNLRRVRSTPSLSRSLGQPVLNVHEPMRLPRRDRYATLEPPGKGSISFQHERTKPRRTTLACGSIVLSKGGHLLSAHPPILIVHVYNEKINLAGPDAYRFKEVKVADLSAMNLLHFEEPSRYLWVSLDRERGCIKVGRGYMLESNVLVRFEPKNASETESVHQVMERIEKIQLGDTWVLVSPMKYWRLPVVRDPPHLVIPGESNTMSVLDRGTAMIAAWLPMEASRLYSTVHGSGIHLEPEYVKWINHSIRTKGCTLNQTLDNKDRTSNVSARMRSSYIRVGMGVRAGDSIGDMFVLEIWPVGHESAIHSHGDAAGIIKVLHGAIEVAFYNPLAEENNVDLQPFKTVVLKKGDITFMTPEFYQTHKLRNLRKDTVTVTMQCYSYLGIDSTHREHFDYLSEIDHKLHRFQPRRDFDFDELLEVTKNEYEERAKPKKFFGVFCVTGETSQF